MSSDSRLPQPLHLTHSPSCRGYAASGSFNLAVNNRFRPRPTVANDRLRHMLVRHDTPNGSTAVVVWYDVAPDVAAWLVGLCVVGTSRIWFARMDVAWGLRARLPRWPLSPTSDRPAIVITPSH